MLRFRIVPIGPLDQLYEKMKAAFLGQRTRSLHQLIGEPCKQNTELAMSPYAIRIHLIYLLFLRPGPTVIKLEYSQGNSQLKYMTQRMVKLKIS
jgi:hypothetical protein